MKSMYKFLFKRSIDIFGSLLGLIVLSPLLLIIAICVRMFLGSPIIFRQKRVGYRGKIFEIYKFCSMTKEKDGTGKLLSDFERTTKFGLFLRKFSLDELPELWNVLIGDMSFVGPRPFLAEYLPRYNKEQIRRHDVKPGITGWAQVHGRNAISWKEKFEYDVWYVDHVLFWLDIKILFLTLLKTIKSEGISQKDHVTMEKFMGNDT